jgi:hypothetical protein
MGQDISRKAAKTQRGEVAKKKDAKRVLFPLSSLSLLLFAALREIPLRLAEIRPSG